MAITWQEYSYGELASEVTEDGVIISGTHVDYDYIPLSDTWNGYYLLSEEAFGGAVDFSVNMTVDQLTQGEFWSVIGIRATGTMDAPQVNTMSLGPYYYTGCENTFAMRRIVYGDMGYTHFVIDPADIVVGQTHQYGVHVENGVISYYLDGVLRYSESALYDSFNVEMAVGVKYSGTSTTVTFNDIYVFHDTSPPVAEAGSDLTTTVGVPVVFDGSLSYDNVGIVTYEWAVAGADAVILTGPVVTHVFETMDVYEVTLTVWDAAGNNGSDVLSAFVYGSTITLTKFPGAADGSAIYWLLEPSQPGEWYLKLDNYGLRSVTIELYNATSGVAQLVTSTTLKASSFDAYPTGVIISPPVPVTEGCSYIVKLTPSGSAGAYALVNEMVLGYG